MLTLRLIPCLFALLGCLCAQADDLPLFATRDAQVGLVNTDGVRIEAVIRDVLPQRQSVRILVPEQGRSFDLPLDTLDEPSQQISQEWFFKRTANQNLAFKAGERLLGRTDADAGKEGIPAIPGNAVDIRLNERTREKDLSVEVRNSSNYALEHLDVVIGLFLTRDISGPEQTTKSRMEREVRTRHNGISIASGASVTLDSTAVPLLNYTLRYDIQTDVAVLGGGTVTQTDRYRTQITDRIASYYILVYYKEELVAAQLSQRYLAALLKANKVDEWNVNHTSAEKIEVTEEVFDYSSNRGRRVLEDGSGLLLSPSTGIR